MTHRAARSAAWLGALVLTAGLPADAAPALDAAQPGADVAPAPPPRASDRQDPRDGTFDIDFQGGSVRSYVNMLQAKLGEIGEIENFILMGDAIDADDLLPAIKLRRANVPVALATLRLLGLANVHIDVATEQMGQASPVRRVSVVRMARHDATGPVDPRVSIEALTGLVGPAGAPGTFRIEDVLTAAEAASKAAAETTGVGGAASFRFHPETDLLVISGSSVVVEAAEQAIEQLRQVAEHRAGEGERLTDQINLVRKRVIELSGEYSYHQHQISDRKRLIGEARIAPDTTDEERQRAIDEQQAFLDQAQEKAKLSSEALEEQRILLTHLLRTRDMSANQVPDSPDAIRERIGLLEQELSGLREKLARLEGAGR